MESICNYASLSKLMNNIELKELFIYLWNLKINRVRLCNSYC